MSLRAQIFSRGVVWRVYSTTSMRVHGGVHSDCQERSAHRCVDSLNSALWTDRGSTCMQWVKLYGFLSPGRKLIDAVPRPPI